MSDCNSYVHLPPQLFSSRRISILASSPHDDEQFAAHQTEFVRHLFGRCAYLRAQSRETPISDAFLSVFVNLIDLIGENAPAEAAHCMDQLRRILALVSPDDASATQTSPLGRGIGDRTDDAPSGFEPDQLAVKDDRWTHESALGRLSESHD